ncbi:hypothetical protein M3598_23215 [Cytobacillus oceanisediminis]|uniref:hypothetical protein n=1 Tax=Cytobacillus oceanisediminis TaxID=665099 RepID=UPI0020411472|nr:hypothetical protein [Cytobacillus oceanisediminis]MCM3245657.1 hypothetical protein [Cytobacillus oceanisediminis]
MGSGYLNRYGLRCHTFSSAKKPEGTGSGNPAPIHVAVPTSKLKEWKEGVSLKARTEWLSEGPLKCAKRSTITA